MNQKNQFPNFNKPEFQSPAIMPSPSRLGLIIKIIAGVIVLIVGVGGVGIALATRFWDPLWNPFRPEPEEVIENMGTNMMGEIKTLHSETKLDIKIREGEKDYFAISLFLRGDRDLNEPENPKNIMDFDVSIGEIDKPENTMFLSAEVRTIDKVSYFKLDNIKLPSPVGLLGIDFNEIKGQWIKIDKEGLESLINYYSGVFYREEISEKQKETVEKSKKLFLDKKIYFLKEELKDEKINKKKMYHYLLALDREKIKEVILEMVEIVMEAPGQSANQFYSPAIVEAFVETLDEFFEKIGEITFEFWIGKEDELLYKIKAEKEIDTRKFDIYGQDIIIVKLDMEFSDFDKPLKIEPPESFRDLKEILSLFQLQLYKEGLSISGEPEVETPQYNQPIIGQYSSSLFPASLIKIFSGILTK